MTGFEPARAKPKRFLVVPVNHSGKLSLEEKCQRVCERVDDLYRNGRNVPIAVFPEKFYIYSQDLCERVRCRVPYNEKKKDRIAS